MTPEAESRLVFGQIPEKEAASRRLRARRKNPPSNPNSPYMNAAGLLSVALSENRSLEADYRLARQKHARKAAEAFTGEAKPRIPSVDVSLAVSCLKMVGYAALAEQLGIVPKARSPKVELAALAGSAIHYELLRKIRNLGLGSIEVSLNDDELGIRARADALIRNPLVGRWQLYDFKVVNPRVFSHIRMENGVYKPHREDLYQMLLYLFLAQKKCAQNEIPQVGVIVYIDRGELDPEKMKQSVVYLDAEGQFTVQPLLVRIARAQERLLNGELPEQSVESIHICQYFCAYSPHCEVGQKYMARGIKKPIIRKPPWLVKKIIADKEERERWLIEQGIRPDKFPEF